jgi:hypothetical protein
MHLNTTENISSDLNIRIFKYSDLGSDLNLKLRYTRRKKQIQHKEIAPLSGQAEEELILLVKEERLYSAHMPAHDACASDKKLG